MRVATSRQALLPLASAPIPFDPSSDGIDDADLIDANLNAEKVASYADAAFTAAELQLHHVLIAALVIVRVCSAEKYG